MEIIRDAWKNFLDWREKNYEASGMGEEAFPGAGISADQLTGMLGLSGGLKLFRGVPAWYRGQMVRGGRHKGPTHYLDINDAGNMIYKPKVPIKPGSNIYKGGHPDMLYTSPNINVAKNAAKVQKRNTNLGVDRFGNPIKFNPKILEYDIPLRDINKYSSTPFSSSKDALKQSEILFPKGLPKKYLKKVHKLLGIE